VLSSRGLTFTELLGQTTHYSGRVRREALVGAPPALRLPPLATASSAYAHLMLPSKRSASTHGRAAACAVLFLPSDRPCTALVVRDTQQGQAL
jgi:hypothetical protein